MKKMYFILLTLLLLGTVGAKAQVTIGADRTAANGAVLELVSDSKVLLLPRVSNAQRANMNTPGLIIFNSDDNVIQFSVSTGSAGSCLWKTLSAAGPYSTDAGTTSGSTGSFTGVKISADNSPADNKDAILQLETSTQAQALLLPKLTTLITSKKGAIVFKGTQLCTLIADGSSWKLN